MSDLSVCMMVRDGGQLFAEALESIRDFDAQVCVLIDNRTEDNTAEIARNFGAEVKFHDWPDDFGAARNLSLEPATRKWILVLDHDERFEKADINHISEILDAEEEYAAIRITTLNRTPGGITAQFIPRFIRNGKVSYEGIKHHELVIEGAERFAPARIYHSGYNLSPAKMRAKRDRDIALLTIQIEAEPEKTYYRRNLIRSLRGTGDTERLLDEAAELNYMVETSNVRITDLSMQLVMLDVGSAHTTHGDFGKAEDIFAQLTRDFPHNPDGWFYLGCTLHSQEKYTEAAVALSTYVSVLYTLRTSASPPNVIVETWNATGQAYTLMTECYLETSQWSQYQSAVNAAIMNTVQDFASSFSSKLVGKIGQLEAEIEGLRNPKPQVTLA